jgi:hypothetical protein
MTYPISPKPPPQRLENALGRLWAWGLVNLANCQYPPAFDRKMDLITIKTSCEGKLQWDRCRADLVLSGKKSHLPNHLFTDD